MLEPIINNEPSEIEEIDVKGYTKTVDPLEEKEPVVMDKEPKETEPMQTAMSKLDETTAKSLEIRYRIFNGNDIRMQKDEQGDVWFVASDVCSILGYTKDTASVIKQHCNKVYDSSDLEEGKEFARKIMVRTEGGTQAMIAINEPDLYRLIMRSRKEEAKAFEKWVMEDVLPTIRKTGKYKVKRKIDYVPQAQAPKAPEQVQLELFPNNFSMSLGRELTAQVNEAKRHLAEAGHTFPTNKEYLAFLVTKGLEAIHEH